MWGAWLATYGLIFSKMSTIPHTAYMSALAAPAGGVVRVPGSSCSGGPTGRKDGAAGCSRSAVAAEVAWAFYLWRDYSSFLPWARDFLVAAGAVAVVALVVARLYRAAGPSGPGLAW